MYSVETLVTSMAEARAGSRSHIILYRFTSAGWRLVVNTAAMRASEPLDCRQKME